jgi:hypothetical protein
MKKAFQSFERELFIWLHRYPQWTNSVTGFGQAICMLVVGKLFPWNTAGTAVYGVVSTLGWVLFFYTNKRVERLNKLMQSESKAHSAVRKLLATLAAQLGHPTKHVRANIMLTCKDGKRRKVQSETAFNMDNDPDCDLELEMGNGVSGEAAARLAPAFGNLRAKTPKGAPDWRLTNSEKGKIRPTLQAVLSVPIFDPDDSTRKKILGTLQVDSDEPFVKLRFHQKDTWDLVESFADVIALHLKVGS